MLRFLFYKLNLYTAIFCGFTLTSCNAHSDTTVIAAEPKVMEGTAEAQPIVVVGASRFELYLSDIENKRVGIVANQTSMVEEQHLVDVLLSKNVNLKRVFAPEHGFRGKHDAGEYVLNSKDIRTGLEVFSLHGSTKKPTKESLRDIDVMLFDIQDVGVRFYTYISTLHYVMEACAENGIPLILLDRPNPNAHYIDGPVLEKNCQSFVGMHPVPVVYGMTIGEYGQMINGEYWLKDSMQCELKVVPLANWNHQTEYILPVAPSPNLPNQKSIYLYPSLCFFEATTVSIGRGTDFPFQVYGHPEYPDTTFSFVPRSIPGKSKSPKLEGEKCYGNDLSKLFIKELREWKSIHWEYFLEMDSLLGKDAFMERQRFFELLLGKKFDWKLSSVGEFNKLIGNELELEEFKKIREEYLIY